MKKKIHLILLTLSLVLLAGCYTTYVSDIESYYFTRHCRAKTILILSSEENSHDELNKNLCSELDNLFRSQGFAALKYCPVKFDTTEYTNIIEKNNPEFVLCIFPQKPFNRKVQKEQKMPYKIEALYRRESGKISSVYLGKIEITYSAEKKSEILKDASGKIFNMIVQNHIIESK